MQKKLHIASGFAVAIFRSSEYSVAIATDSNEAHMDRDFDTEMDVLDRDFDLPLVPPIARRNPGSVAEMLARVEYLKSLERPLTDAELAAKYPESVIDDDAEWDDREDPNYFAWLED